ncbi:Ribosomal protein S16 [Pseudomonas syringae pv. helianthi]|uniref:Ribosomal protein S16 n=1 Tax=Pseudomonas syringae pv. helianthi TaxID=251654 RepID=A0A0P9RNZ3_9PSED|nr:Ribosomal protein S16 [Pseudomonas syringae pv. helianthi]
MFAASPEGTLCAPFTLKEDLPMTLQKLPARFRHLPALILFAFTLGLSSAPACAAEKSAKRGIAYDVALPADLSALSSGVSWWYNWSPKAHDRLASYDYASTYSVDFIPMVWNDNLDDGQLKQYLLAHPSIHYLLVINEPNLLDQANLAPEAAASFWPRLEQIAAQTGVKLVGPAMN